MRKANKILMATVAILLCLVLITTSVASGIFAKFVITKSGSATLKLTKFGVTISMTHNTDKLTSLKATVSEKEIFTSTGYVFTISNLKLKPGDDLTDAVRFDFEGKPNVSSVKIKITPTITYTDAMHNHTASSTNKTHYYNYYMPVSMETDDKGTIRNLNLVSVDTYYMPIGFTFSANGTTADGNYVVDPWRESTDKSTVVSASEMQTALRDGIKNKMNATLDTVNTNTVVVTPTIDTDTNSISFTVGGTSTSGFNMGFAYPTDWSTETNDQEFYDNVSTYMANHIASTASITVSYRVEIIQA